MHARIQKIFSGGGGVFQIPRTGLTENFNMAKINNLAIPGGSGPPVPTSGSAHEIALFQVFMITVRTWHCIL